MFKIFQSHERKKWKLPCYRNAQVIYLSDSQFRELTKRNLIREVVPMIISNKSNVFIKSRKCLNNHWNRLSNESATVIRGASFPDLMNLLTVGFVKKIGCKFVVFFLSLFFVPL